MDILGTSLTNLIAGKHKAQDISDFYGARIQKHNPLLNAFIDGQVDSMVRSNRLTGDLKGLPIALKDNIVTKCLTTTASSDILKDYVSPFDATLVQKLKKAGGHYIGKTNLDAWAHGSSTETSAFGPTLNPYNTDYVAGGSSGGSAVAVAAGLVPAAIGTETAGSIKTPASWSGVVGLKPTYGRVSRFGIIAMGSSWDCPGPMTQTVEDAALLLGIIAGHDKRDATTQDIPVEDYTAALSEKRKLTIGISKDYFENVDVEVMKHVDMCLDFLNKQGHTVKEIDLIHPKYAISVYMLLQRSEVSSNLGRYDGIRYGQNRSHFGQEAERRIMLGTYALSAGYADQFYKKAQKVRYVIRESFERAFEDVDVIFAPTMPITATKVGDSESWSFYGEAMDVLSEPGAAAGIPSISLPSGLHTNGLPIGVQFMGRHFEESTIINIAHHLEKELSFDRLSVMKKYE